MKPITQQNAKQKKAYVGMSGGVDSSVSAALLKQQGYDVTGVFIKVWQPDFMECTWKDDRRDSMRVCAQLGIPHITLNLEDEYKKEVVDYMVAEYTAGRTPNPDAMCNKYIKFGLFFKYAIAQGADVVATGHYAQIKKEGDTYFMHEGVDVEKDQSYFLWTLTQDHLSKTIFPIGGYQKSKVRALAKKFNLINAQKKDSQGLCFLGKVDMKEFLSHYIPLKKGIVLDEKENQIGEHDGVAYLTIGQRHGFVVWPQSTDQKPYYIISKNVEKNTITVSTEGKSPLIKGLCIDTLNWNSIVPTEKKTYLARFRYHQKPIECTVFFDSILNKFCIEFNELQEYISVGQSLVLYDQKKCLGGGTVSLVYTGK